MNKPLPAQPPEGRSSWELALEKFEAALDAQELAAEGAAVSWRICVFETGGVLVTPWLHRVSRAGGRSPGTRTSPSRILRLHGHELPSEDLRVAEQLLTITGVAPHSALLSLANHPRVFLDESPELAVRVERATAGIVAEDRGRSVALHVGLDGTPLPRELVRRLRRPRRDEPAYLWDRGARLLTVLEAPPQLRAFLDILDVYGNEFPPESREALLSQLSRASTRLPVALPRSILGTAVLPNVQPVLRLELTSPNRVRLELRVRALPEAAALLPGEGLRDVYVRRGADSLHAVRNFDRERAEARELMRALQLSPWLREETEFVFDLPLQPALAVLAQAEQMTPRPALEWREAPLRVVGTAHAGSLKVAMEKRRDWFGALGSISMGDRRVELAVVLDAARRNERFVRVGEREFAELSQTLLEKLQRLSDHTYTSRHGLEVGPSAADALNALAEAGANISADEAWQALVQRIFAARATHPRVPPSLQTTLRPYQREGYEWLMRLAAWGAGGILADDMGLGKTVQALALLLARRKLGPSLVLAPTSVGFNWVAEATRFAPKLKLHNFAEATDRGALLARLGPSDVVILSYGLLQRDIERLKGVRFSTIVLDEAQALKNAGTRRARAARELNGDFIFALSGTPLENHLGELWSLFRIVFPGLLGSWDAFRERFALPIEKKLDPTAGPALGRVLEPFLLRRTKAEVASELPEREEISVPVVLSPAEWQLYEDARLAAVSDLSTPTPALKEQERRLQVLAALTRLRRIACHPRLYDPTSPLESSKSQRFLELVEGLTANGHRALVFSQFTSHLALVRELLDARGIPYVYLDGATPAKERGTRVASFQAGTAPLFLISLKAGGFGLNLTAADNVIHLDPWWNPAIEDQASDRAHRIGQTRKVTVYRLIVKGTIEEEMLALHRDKRALVSEVLDGKAQAARLSSQQLFSLLTGSVAGSPSALRH